MAVYSILYAWGKNEKGELSRGCFTNLLTPKPTKGPSDLTSVASGGSHSVAIGTKGTVYVCGNNLHGKLGIEGSGKAKVTIFSAVSGLEESGAQQVACGEFHTLCLLQDKSVYAWGGNLHQKLGQREDMRRPSSVGPVQALQQQSVAAVACGDFHSVALTEDGRLFSWGGGGQYNKGQCGHGHCRNLEVPTLVATLSQIVIDKVSCGGHHTVAMTVNGQSYAWGAGEYGQCGTGDFSNLTLPRLVKLEQQLKGISAGGHHTLFLTQDWEVFACGYNVVGQLGLDSKTNQAVPQLAPVSHRVRQVAAGWTHSLLLTEFGEVLATGYGKYGQLGLGSVKSVRVFTAVTVLAAKPVSTVFAGGHHSWALVESDHFADIETVSPIASDYIETGSAYSSPMLKVNRSLSVYGEILDFTLTLSYTDVEYCHRYIRCTLQDPGKDFLEEYVAEVTMNEAGLQHSRIEHNGSCNYSVLLVCDPTQNDPPVNPTGATEAEDCYFEVTPQDLASSSLQEALCEWVRFFCMKLDKYLTDTPVFFELRPVFYFPT